MRHLIFAPEQSSYDIAILIKDSYFNKTELYKHYIAPLVQKGISAEKIIAFDLQYEGKKVSAKTVKEYLTKITPSLKNLGVKFIYCADATYFKALTKQTKADPYLGYVLDCVYEDYMRVIYGLNYSGLVYNPNQYPKLDLSIQTLASVYQGNYKELGQNVIQHADYPETEQQIEWFLNSLHQYPSLVCDIETFSLELHKAHLGSIAFAWNEHSGGSFLVDYKPVDRIDDSDPYGEYVENPKVKRLLKQFFEKYKGNIKYHNATYDVKVLILNLFMQHPQDYEGMLHGLGVLTRSIDDTKIIAFLALNTTADISLGLKDLSHEYLGNYAQDDIKDIRRIYHPQLLEYNLTDCLGTWYVYKKYYPTVIQDSQEWVYRNIMIPSTKIIIQMELVGMPINAAEVLNAEEQLKNIENDCMAKLRRSSIVDHCQQRLQLNELAKINSKLKTKQHGMDKVKDYLFNPNSSDHLKVLLFEVMSLPVLDTTPTKEPATGAGTIGKLINHTTNPEFISVLETLIELSKVSKILSAFIPAFKNATPKADGMSYLHANFNLNGTVSGRMSCNNPNLQQIPSGSQFAKLIKGCFQAPKGWVFCSADFASLEDRINTLLTKDPNKLSVYTQGFDGHCLRAAYYFNIPNIDLNDPKSVNAIKHSHPKERQDSKAPTFALTYQGTWATLMKNCGFDEATAKSIENNYHILYQVSDQWLQDKLDLCCKQGYIDVAFGLRIRTPLLARSVLGNSKTLREAQAEARSVGNALSGQSYGLLNNRAAIAFMNKVWASQYKYSIFLVSMIHDAIYLIIKNDLDTLKWVNDNLPQEMSWQELPEIQHPEVKLGAELDVHYPSWAQAITLPNHATREEIYKICRSNQH